MNQEVRGTTQRHQSRQKRRDWLTEYCPVWYAPPGKYLNGTIQVVDVTESDPLARRFEQALTTWGFEA